MDAIKLGCSSLLRPTSVHGLKGERPLLLAALLDPCEPLPHFVETGSQSNLEGLIHCAERMIAAIISCRSVIPSSVSRMVSSSGVGKSFISR